MQERQTLTKTCELVIRLTDRQPLQYMRCTARREMKTNLTSPVKAPPFFTQQF